MGEAFEDEVLAEESAADYQVSDRPMLCPSQEAAP